MDSHFIPIMIAIIKTHTHTHTHTHPHTQTYTEEITSIGEHMDKLEPLCIPSRNVQWCSHGGKEFGSSLKVKQDYYVIQQFHSRCTPARLEKKDLNRSYIAMIIAALFTITKRQKQPKYPSTDKKM